MVSPGRLRPLSGGSLWIGAQLPALEVHVFEFSLDVSVSALSAA